MQGALTTGINSLFIWQHLTKVTRVGLTFTSVRYYKNRKAGIPKTTTNQNRPLTYEEAQPPHCIGVTKAWNSWNTSNLDGEGRKAQTAIEDALIRKFIAGTFTGTLGSEVIIKRRHNTINLAFCLLKQGGPTKLYFLVGYLETMLSHLLKCPVKIELQLYNSRSSTVFKMV